MATSFHRGLTICDCCPTPDGWAWRAYVAVSSDHPLHGTRFFSLASGLTLTHVVHVTGLALHDSHWWFVIDDEWANDDDAMLQLRKASDELTSMTRGDDTC